MLFPDNKLLKELKIQADKYLKLFKADDHWKIGTKELENWYSETCNLGKRFIKVEENLIEYRELGAFIGCKNSMYDNRIAVNIKHKMKTTLKCFYNVFRILFKKLYGKSYPTEKLPKII